GLLLEAQDAARPGLGLRVGLVGRRAAGDGRRALRPRRDPPGSLSAHPTSVCRAPSSHDRRRGPMPGSADARARCALAAERLTARAVPRAAPGGPDLLDRRAAALAGLAFPAVD